MGNVQYAVSSSAILRSPACYPKLVGREFKLTAVFQGRLHLVQPFRLRCLNSEIIARPIVAQTASRGGHGLLRWTCPNPGRMEFSESTAMSSDGIIFQSVPAQSPSPGLAEKYLSNFPVSSQ